MSNVDFGRYKRIVRAFWDPEPRNDSGGQCIWCLGKEYASQSLPNGVKEAEDDDRRSPDNSEILELKQDAGRSQPSAPNGAPPEKLEVDTDRGWPPEFLDDCESRIWFTYRSNFPAIKKSTEASMTLSVRLRSLSDQSGFTSDTGWGCMIRSGQSLLANALVMLRLGRGIFHMHSMIPKAKVTLDWRRGNCENEERQLLSLFADDPSAPFSIHKFVEHGASACGKHPGEWFGPSATARCIQ